MTILALMGPTALYLLLIWLASAAASASLARRKGYREETGLATGLLLTFVGVLVWLVIPPRTPSGRPDDASPPRLGE